MVGAPGSTSSHTVCVAFFLEHFCPHLYSWHRQYLCVCYIVTCIYVLWIIPTCRKFTFEQYCALFGVSDDVTAAILIGRCGLFYKRDNIILSFV